MSPARRDDRASRRDPAKRSARPRPPAGNGDRRPWAAEGGLPKWVTESLARVTPKARIPAATAHLETAAKAFAAGKLGKALSEAEAAKELSPREATIRELIGLSAYRLGRWDLALRELRTFRRFTGESTHVPIELDVLRALDRPADVEDLWKRFQQFDADGDTRNEARVVFASFLMDRGEDHRAWEVSDPKRLGEDPGESELRVWYVAARAAQRLGDTVTARRLYEAVEAADPAFPGLDDLDRLIGSPPD
jgi:tetratricopeptide (TPR) repeat protein